jgi:hypothetical protein
LSGNRFTKEKKLLNQEFFIVFLTIFVQLLSILYLHGHQLVLVCNVFERLSEFLLKRAFF